VQPRRGAIRIGAALAQIGVLLIFALAVGCARNTVSASGDGRLFLLLDINPQVASRHAIVVDVEVENREPVQLKLWSGLTSPRMDVSDALDWAKWQGRPIDLIGDVIPGGTEVRFRVTADNNDDRNDVMFNLDGSTIIRLVPSDPRYPLRRQHMMIELTVQHALF